MAAQFIQSTGKARSVTAVDSQAASFGSLPAVGRFILVQVFGWNSSNNLDFTTTATTDNQGNTYARAIQSTLVGGARAAIFYCERVATSAGTFTVTVNPGGASGPLVMVCTEWAGVFAGSLLATATDTSGPGTLHDSGATAAASGLVAAVMTISGTNSLPFTVNPPAYDEQCEEPDNAAFQAGECDTRVTGAAVAQSCTWTSATSIDSTACIAVFSDTRAVLTTTQTWPWPDGVTSLTAEGIGGGGGGGAASGNPATGGGGKGGGYAKVVVTKAAESTLTINIGALGTGGVSTAAGGNGTPSEVVQGGSTVLRAPGGNGGAVGSANSTNGAGATAANGTAVGSTTFAGGNGGTGNFTSGVQGSGAGGGAAGPTSVGGAASVNTAGTAGTGTFVNGTAYQSAGSAGVGNNLAGIAAANYGGGGSGGKTIAAANQNGGNGAAGMILLTWANATSAPPPLPVPRFYEQRRIM